MSETREKFFSMLKDWEETIPADTVPFVRGIIDAMPEETVADFNTKFEAAGVDWGYASGAELADTVMSSVLDRLLKYTINGRENLTKALDMLAKGEADRIVVVSNHLSYSDANIFASAFRNDLSEAGFAGQLSVIAGPKVFQHPIRKFACMQFNSILVAQSQSVATAQAAYPMRVIAQAAVRAVKDIREKVKILLIFPEGKRSRSKEMDHFLAGVYRLVNADENEKTLVVPVSILGGDDFMPIGCGALRYASVKLSVGEAEPSSDIIGRIGEDQNIKQDFMDCLGRKVAALHPENMRGVYKDL